MRKFRRPEWFAAVRRVVLGIGLCCAYGAGWTQGVATGEIHGIVVDSDGNGLSRVGVTARNLDTGEEVRAEALHDGSFTLAPLAPGDYLLRFEGTGRGTTLSVTPGDALELKATVTGSGLRAAVASGPAFNPVEPEAGTVSFTVDGVSVTQGFGAVPLGSGDDAIVNPDGDADSAERTTGASHGLGRGRHAGVDYLYAAGSVREFRVGADGYSAQVSGAGNVLSAVTRQGGDKVHGSAFFRIRSSALAAKDPLAIATSYADGAVASGEVKPHDLRESFGGTFGGPLGPMRIFDAVDLERRGFPAISSPQDPNFYNLTAIQHDLLANRGVSDSAINSALNYLSSLTGETPRRADQAINFARADWRARPRLAVGAEYNLVRWRSPAGLIDAPVVARGRASLGNAQGSVDEVLGRVTLERSSRNNNQVKLAWIRDLQFETPQTPLAQEPAIGPNGTAPEVNIGPNGLLFGTPAGLSQSAYPDEQRMEIGDTATLVRGRHLIRAGGTFGFVHDRIATLGNAAGTFRYDSDALKGYAGGLVDFITDQTFNANAPANGGCPKISAADHLYCFRSFTQSFGEQVVSFDTQDWAGFVEDTWRPLPGLMVHAGLRYEYLLLPFPQHPNATLDAVFGTRGATSIFPEDRNNFAPRISASFEPFGHGRGLVKLGYGIFFGRVPGATIAAALSDTGLASSTTKIRIRPSVETPCPQSPTTGFGYPCSFMAVPPGVAALTSSSIVFDRHFRTPVVQQGSLFIERELGRRTSLELGAVVNEDRQLPSSTDLNIAPSSATEEFRLQGGNGKPGVRDGETFVVPVYRARVSPDFGPVTDVVSHVNATYDALVARVSTRAVRSLLVSVHYTWSKAIDFGQAASAIPRTNGQFDPFANGYDKSLSSLNAPQALHAEAVWTPSGEAAGRHLRRAASGWTVSAIEVARSGRPYSYDLSGGSYLAGGHESLNGSGGALYLPTVGRNTLKLPATLKTDLRVARNFRAWHTAEGVATVEAFNLLNHQSITSVNQRAYLLGTEENGITPLIFQDANAIAAEGLNATPFGTPIGTGSSLNRAREFQLSVRIAF